jgi:hypothetical protein
MTIETELLTAYADAQARLARAVTTTHSLCPSEPDNGPWCGACQTELRAAVAADCAELEYADAHRQCVGVYRRHCANPARPDSAYCSTCAPAFDALCNGTPPAPAVVERAGLIERTDLLNGNVKIHIDRRVLFLGSQTELDALAVFLGDTRQEALEVAAALLSAAYDRLEDSDFLALLAA